MKGNPFVPFAEYQPGEHEDDAALAAWLLDKLDAALEPGPRLCGIAIPHAVDDDELAALEALMIRAYDLAKELRPGLCVKFLHAIDDRSGEQHSRVLMILHEHKWVDGQCVNGCTDTRKVG